MKFRKIKILAKLFCFLIKPWFLIIVFHLKLTPYGQYMNQFSFSLKLFRSLIDTYILRQLSLKKPKHGLFSLAIYHFGLEKIEGSWRWTRDSTLVFDPSLCYANEPNGQSLLCGCFVFNVGVFGGRPVVADVPCTTLLHIICEL